MTFLLAVLLLVIAVGLLAYLLALLLTAIASSGLSGSLGGMTERAAFRRLVNRCRHGDRLLERGDLAGAVNVFAEAFFLRPVKKDMALLSDIGNHHTGLLSRLLTVADEMGKGRTRLPSLAQVDHLLAERLELQLDYFRARKRGAAKQMRNAERRLKENEDIVREGLSRLIAEIRTSEEKVLYH
jgi:hypothetical protein